MWIFSDLYCKKIKLLFGVEMEMIDLVNFEYEINQSHLDNLAWIIFLLNNYEV